MKLNKILNIVIWTIVAILWLYIAYMLGIRRSDGYYKHEYQQCIINQMPASKL